MREHDMRMRVFRFLKARMRNMIMPATVGIGLAVGGCAKEGLTAADSAPPADSAVSGEDGNTQPKPDVLADLATAADAAADRGASEDVLASDASVDAAKPDGTADGRDVASGSDQAVAIDVGGGDTGIGVDGTKDIASRPDAGPELGGPKYIAPFVDAAADSIIVAPLYAVVMPDAQPAGDAAPADSMVLRYAVVIPREDALIAAPMYMAPPPRES